MKKLRYTLIALSTALSACATSPTGRSQLMLVSPEQAISASAEAYAQTLAPLQSKGIVDNNIATSKRVRTITGRVIHQAIEQFPNTKNWDWSVKVIDDPENVNAWCMAGGKMAIYTGLLNKVQPTDDELAQVMGHEIAHALANHTAEKMSVAMATQIGVAGAAIASNNSRYQTAAISGAALAAQVAVSLPNSRTAESEADQIGMQLAARAGYHPDAAVTLWQKMAKVGGARQPAFLSTHPAPEDRQEKLAKLAPKMMRFYQPGVQKPTYNLK